VDNVIDQLVFKSANPGLIKGCDLQKLQHKLWQDSKKYHSSITLLFRLEKVEVGDKVDLRDTEYIWCVGRVKIKIDSPNKEALLVVHYEGWNKYYDEIVKQSSCRIAPFGTYTGRNDIPRYVLKEDNSMIGSIVNRIMPKQPQ
jgi:hypothetical protein